MATRSAQNLDGSIWLKKLICMVILHIILMMQASSELVHRYLFDNHTDDVIGDADLKVRKRNGQPNVSNSDAHFKAITPSRTTQISPQTSLDFTQGANLFLEKPNNVIKLPEKGTYCFWMMCSDVTSSKKSFLLKANGHSFIKISGGNAPARIWSKNSAQNNEYFDDLEELQWNFIALSWDNTSTQNVYSYINGKINPFDLSDNSVLVDKVMALGAYNAHAIAEPSWFKGYMYDLQIYDNVLDQSELKYLYQNAGSTLPAAKPVFNLE